MPLFQHQPSRLLDTKADFYVQHVLHSYQQACEGKSKLSQAILTMEGYSGKMTRHFYNNLLSLQDARYLEVGTWKGSSTCAALHGNDHATATCIDNWSQFNGPRDEFMTNLETHTNKDSVKVIEADCWTVDASQLGKHNVYLYDGDHAKEAQHKGITHFLDALDDTFILVVDDWNWSSVSEGTFDGIKEANLEVVYKKEIYSAADNQHVYQPIGREQWWNGMLVAVCKKPTPHH